MEEKLPKKKKKKWKKGNDKVLHVFTIKTTGLYLSSGDIHSIILECPFDKCNGILMGGKKLHLLPSIPKVIK